MVPGEKYIRAPVLVANNRSGDVGIQFGFAVPGGDGDRAVAHDFNVNRLRVPYLLPPDPSALPPVLGGSAIGLPLKNILQSYFSVIAVDHLDGCLVPGHDLRKILRQRPRSTDQQDGPGDPQMDDP